MFSFLKYYMTIAILGALFSATDLEAAKVCPNTLASGKVLSLIQTGTAQKLTWRRTVHFTLTLDNHETIRARINEQIKPKIEDAIESLKDLKTKGLPYRALTPLITYLERNQSGVLDSLPATLISIVTSLKLATFTVNLSSQSDSACIYNVNFEVDGDSQFTDQFTVIIH